MKLLIENFRRYVIEEEVKSFIEENEQITEEELKTFIKNSYAKKGQQLTEEELQNIPHYRGMIIKGIPKT